MVSKNAKICVSPNANVKICITPNATPNTSQWNIDCVGSPGIGACVGHVHFMLFMSISFALGSQLERSFRWNMGLKVSQQAVVILVNNFQTELMVEIYTKSTVRAIGKICLMKLS